MSNNERTRAPRSCWCFRKADQSGDAGAKFKAKIRKDQTGRQIFFFLGTTALIKKLQMSVVEQDDDFACLVC